MVSHMTTATTHTYTLYDGDTGEPIRTATAWETTLSLLAADVDGGYGFILVDGRKAFVA